MKTQSFTFDILLHVANNVHGWERITTSRNLATEDMSLTKKNAAVGPTKGPK
jgi:hypothetical protein